MNVAELKAEADRLLTAYHNAEAEFARLRKAGDPREQGAAARASELFDMYEETQFAYHHLLRQVECGLAGV